MLEETNTCRLELSTAMSPNPLGSSVPAAVTGDAAVALVQVATSATTTANSLTRNDIDVRPQSGPRGEGRTSVRGCLLGALRNRPKAQYQRRSPDRTGPVASPIWPNLFQPQAHTVPSARS